MATAKQQHSDPARGILALNDLPAPADICDMLDFMRAERVTQLWVCGPLYIDRRAVALDTARRAGWDIRISPPRDGALPDADDPAAQDDWTLAYRAGEYTPEGYSLVWPALDPRRIWWDRDDEGNPTNPPTDAQALRQALATYARAVGIPYYRTPQTTGGRLLRALHSGPHATALETATTGKAAMPEPAQRDNGSLIQDAPIMWRRPVSDDELSDAPYLLTFDCNAQFLRAANGLPLGFGDVAHLEGARAQALVATAFQQGPTQGPRLIAPGYYRVWANPRAGICSLPIPHPLYRAGFPDRPFSAPGGWVNAPTVRLLVELQLPFLCAEAYVWRESHRFFDPWYKRLNTARLALMGDASDAGALALSALKATYAQFIGALAMDKRSDADALKRPDWRHADISQARALHYRAMLRAVDAGHYPVYVTEDTLGFLSPTPDAAAAAAALDIRLSQTTGHYKLKDCVDTRQRVDVREALCDTQGGQAKDLQMLLARVRREQKAEVSA